LAVNNAKLAAHPRGSECLLAQNVIVVDDPKQVAKWQARLNVSPDTVQAQTLQAAQRVTAAVLEERDALAADSQRMREALAGAGTWIKDVTDLVLFPLAYEVQGGLGAEADSFGGRTVELLRGIEAALTTANKEPRHEQP
jgi:hypothetical protein